MHDVQIQFSVRVLIMKPLAIQASHGVMGQQEKQSVSTAHSACYVFLYLVLNCNCLVLVLLMLLMEWSLLMVLDLFLYLGGFAFSIWKLLAFTLETLKCFCCENVPDELSYFSVTMYSVGYIVPHLYNAQNESFVHLWSGSQFVAEDTLMLDENRNNFQRQKHSMLALLIGPMSRFCTSVTV